MSFPFSTAPPAISGTINLRAVSGLLRAQQDPCKGQGMSWSEADQDLDMHSRKDVHDGTLFPLRSDQVSLALLPSNTDVFHPYDMALPMPSSQLRAEVCTEISSVCHCSYLCLWWVLILMWTTDQWLNMLPYCWWAITAHQFGQPCVLTEPCCTVQ